MTQIVIVVCVALMLLLVVAVAAMRQRGQLNRIADIERNWQKVDMEAFLNLVDPSEERYLRQHLPTAEFTRLHRQRVRAMWEYLGRLAFNSRLMMQAGQMVQHHSSGEQLHEATQLVAAASRMRILIFAADVYLAVRFVLPHTQDPICKLVSNYDSLTQLFTHACGNELASARSMAG